jgi:hypothetical protein
VAGVGVVDHRGGRPQNGRRVDNPIEHINERPMRANLKLRVAKHDVPCVKIAR